ncbi:unnamed protein product, partial [Amoebophrya sp. A120]
SSRHPGTRKCCWADTIQRRCAPASLRSTTFWQSQGFLGLLWYYPDPPLLHPRSRTDSGSGPRIRSGWTEGSGTCS